MQRKQMLCGHPHSFANIVLVGHQDADRLRQLTEHVDEIIYHFVEEPNVKAHRESDLSAIRWSVLFESYFISGFPASFSFALRAAFFF